MSSTNNQDFETASPILFLVFNRPETTRLVFDAIRSARPARLYVAGDGPRDDRPGEADVCGRVRNIATNVDWNCDLRTLFREENKGCRSAVSEAISWFFENEEQGIILEDDCVPDPTFFRFCDELLEKYAEDQRVFQISGDNFQRGRKRGNASYYFSIYNHIWGWASWRRAWKHYDIDLDLWPAARRQGLLENISCGWEPFRAYWSRQFERTRKRGIDSWGYVWTFSCWAQGGLTVIPQKNLVENVGFGQEATHTRNSLGKERSPGSESLDFPLKHPELVVRSQAADRFTSSKELGIQDLPQRILRKASGLLNRLKWMA